MKWHCGVIGLMVFGVFLALFVSGGSGLSYEDRVVRVIDAEGGERVRFAVDVADTPLKQVRGLSGRVEMPSERGMLFVYDEPQSLTFWMKDMRFPIDIVWVRESTVVGIEHAVSISRAGDVLRQYHSPVAADMVLEINGGLAEQYGVRVGDMIRLEI